MRASLPRVGFISLWFPKPTETFVFREVITLRRLGLPLKVYTLYGRWRKDLSAEMSAVNGVERLGIAAVGRLPSEILYWFKRAPRIARRLCLEIPLRRWAGLEKGGESLWAFLCGFCLARGFESDAIRHIHASWAGGPATAAWVASCLTGIPFSFSARAWDIYPPDGALRDKIRACAFVRSETAAALPHLHRFAGDHGGKIQVVYNPLTLAPGVGSEAVLRPPFRLLSIGRFVGKKGFSVLLRACRILRDRGLPFTLTLAGSGPLKDALVSSCRALGLEGIVSFPGFVDHDRIRDLLARSDLLIVPSIVHRSGDRDGIPTVIMEALSCRVPVIATDVAGIGEVIRDGVTGLLVPPGEPEPLARAIQEMTRDRERALAMAEEGRKRVLRQFDPERNGRALRDLMVNHSKEGSWRKSFSA